MQKIVHRAAARGSFDFGWLKTNYSFSFGNWHNPARMNFGLLRVLNDDIILPEQGFGTHPHDNMEIVTIPLAGRLAHKDSAGHEEVIAPNDVQVMSAGTGIRHSEYNASATERVSLFQLWVFPDRVGHQPRYDQRTFDPAGRRNAFQRLVSPERDGETLWLNQDTYFSRADMDDGTTLTYRLNTAGNGVYLMVIEGDVTVAGESLRRRDAIGVWDTDTVTLHADSAAQVLAVEVPMG